MMHFKNIVLALLVGTMVEATAPGIRRRDKDRRRLVAPATMPFPDADAPASAPIEDATLRAARRAARHGPRGAADLPREHGRELIRLNDGKNDGTIVQQSGDLGECQGNCDSNYDCGCGLVCWEFDDDEREPPPNCEKPIVGEDLYLSNDNIYSDITGVWDFCACPPGGCTFGGCGSEPFDTEGKSIFEFLYDQVTAESFATEIQDELPYTQGGTSSTSELQDCKNGCNVEDIKCLTACDCGFECDEFFVDNSDGENLCFARCRSSFNGFEISPACLLGEADSLLVCLYGEQEELDPFVGTCSQQEACSKVQADFPGVVCTITGGTGECICQNAQCDEVTNDIPCSGTEAPFTGVCPDRDGGAADDPHFKSWAGNWYDYQGECDLHLVHAPNFALGMNLTIDIRTTVRYEYSYISSAVVVLGKESFEVGSFGAYILDGVSNAELPNTVSGFPIHHSVPDYDQDSGKTHIYTIELAHNETIVLKTYKDWVSVKLEHAHKDRFQSSVGMLGDFTTGHLLGRDGTVMNDPNMLAKEWQVQDNEPMLFASVRAPQHPQECILPDPTKASKRRLGENAVGLDVAKAACASWSENQEGCIHDVMAMGDLGIAASGGF